MTIDIDFTSMSHDDVINLIYLIGKATTSPETLDRIADYVIANKSPKHYISGEYSVFGLESICSNPYLEKKSIDKLVKFYDDDFAIWDLTSRTDLDSETIELIMGHFTNLNIIIDLFDRYDIAKSSVDLLATRLIDGYVRVDKGYYKNGQMEMIIEKCSKKMKARLLNWWDCNVDRLLHHLHPY